MLSAGHLLGLFLGLLDRADVEERAFGKVVPLAVAELLEAADRVGQGGVLARLAGEDLGDEERLRQEPLDPAGAVDDDLVVLGEFVDAEDRDDVAKLPVALKDRLDAAGDVVVLLADVLRVENSGGRAERVDGRDRSPSRRSSAGAR